MTLPRLAFEHCGLFVDSDLAYAVSAEYTEEQEKKAQEMMNKQNLEKGEDTNDPGNNEGNGGADRNSVEARKQSGTSD